MKKHLCLVCLVLFLAGGLFSHEYIVNKNSNLSPNAGNVQITSLTGGNWDDGYYDLTLPAGNQFYFYGKRVTHVRIWTNGYVTFGFGSAPTDGTNFSNDPVPTIGGTDAYAAPWWDDWNLSVRGEIWYIMGGTYLNIEWRDIPHLGDSTSSYDFRMLIGANSNSVYANEFLFYYTDVDSGTGAYDRGASGTIGVEHYTGSQAEKVSYNEQVITNGMSIRITPFVPIYGMTDGWSDDLPDPIVFRTTDGQGYFFCLKNDDPATQELYVWGTDNDVPLPGDYDGNTYYDMAVYRPGNGMWFTNGAVADFTVQWGIQGDIPVPADYDGDGDTDIAVFRPSSGIWFIYYLPAGTTSSAQFGQIGDVPLPADYDNDGLADLAVYRPSNGVWYIRKSSNPAQMYAFAWGADGDIPMPANFQTSAYSTACVYRPSDGQWYSYNQQTAATYVLGSWGLDSDVPVPNDWNGGGATDRCVFRPSNGVWYSTYAGDFQWGQLGDKPRCRFSSLIVAPPPVAAPGPTDGMGRPLNQQ